MKIAPKKQIYVVLCVAFSYLLWIYICLKSSLGPWWYFSSHIIGMGIIWALYEKEIIRFIKVHYNVLLLSSFFGFIVLFVTQNNSYYDLLSFILVASVKAAAIVLYIFILLLLLLKIRIGNPVLKFLGEISYELYLSHGIFVALFRRCYFIKNDLLFSLTVIFSSLFFSYLFHKLCRFVLSRYYYLLK